MLLQSFGVSKVTCMWRLFVSDSCQSFAAAMQAVLQTSSLVGCLSDSRQLSQREITHQVSQGGSLRKVEKADASRQIMSGSIHNMAVCYAQTFSPSSSELLIDPLFFLLTYFFLQISSTKFVLAHGLLTFTGQTLGVFRSIICLKASMMAFSRHSLPYWPSLAHFFQPFIQTLSQLGLTMEIQTHVVGGTTFFNNKCFEAVVLCDQTLTFFPKFTIRAQQ